MKKIFEARNFFENLDYQYVLTEIEVFNEKYLLGDHPQAWELSWLSGCFSLCLWVNPFRPDWGVLGYRLSRCRGRLDRFIIPGTVSTSSFNAWRIITASAKRVSQTWHTIGRVVEKRVQNLKFERCTRARSRRDRVKVILRPHRPRSCQRGVIR